jgi:hypothetical protein
VRIIAATNKDLKGEVDAERFQKDLYYRINVVPLILPKLEDRKEDIPLLAAALVKRYKKGMGAVGDAIRITDDAVRKLELQKEWPGNIRLLDNVIRRAIILSGNGVIDAEQIVFSDREFQGATIRAETLTDSAPTPITVVGAEGSKDATTLGPDEKLWFEAEGGVIPVISYVLKRVDGVKLPPAILALAKNGKIFSLPLSSTKEGGLVYYLTRSSLPQVFRSVNGENPEYGRLLRQLEEGEFNSIAARPFMITTPTNLSLRMGAGHRPAADKIARIARNELSKEMILVDNGSRLVFIIQEETARIFVPAGSYISETYTTPNKALLARMIDAYYYAFRNRTQLEQKQF